MTELDYSKRELDEKFKDIKDSLDRIETQTTRHNGRLTNVERWMYSMMGAIGVLGFLVGAKLLSFF